MASGNDLSSGLSSRTPREDLFAGINNRYDVGRLDLSFQTPRSSYVDTGSYYKPASRDGNGTPRPPSRGTYPEPAQILRISHEIPGETLFTESDGFELMSSCQLRDQLKREQLLRKEKEDEIYLIKHSMGTEMRPATAPGSRAHSSIGKSYDFGTLMDTDSGISNGMSARSLKSPMGMAPHMVNFDDSLNSSRHDYQRMSPRRPSSPSLGADATNWGGSSPMSVKGLKDALHDSEQRRLALVDKLRDAHSSLKIQTQRLCEMEAKLTEREFAVENFSTTQEGLQRKIAELQRDREESVSDKIQTIRKREKLQERIEQLDHELKTLKSAYNSLQSEHRKRELIIDQTHQALKMLEEDNINGQRTRETMLKEAAALREALQMAKLKCEKLGMENEELEKIREVRESSSAQNSDLTNQLAEVRQAKEDLQNQVEVLNRDYNRTKEDRDELKKKAVHYEEAVADINSKYISANAEKERLYQERLDLYQKLQQLTVERERLLKDKHGVDQQLGGVQIELNQTRCDLERKTEDLEKMEEELHAVKKVGEVLSSEMANAKIQMEKAQEQSKQLQSDKRLSSQQQTFMEDEIKRLNSDKEILSQVIDNLKEEHKNDKSKLNEHNVKLKEHLKEMRNEKNHLQTRCQELDTKLQRANKEVKQYSMNRHEELNEWKSTCERLTATINRKESEIIALSTKLQEANDKNAQLRTDSQSLQMQQEHWTEMKEEFERLQEENKRLVQEHAEDQQVIHLLEMQKNILTKNNPSVSPRFTQEQLQAQVDHLKAELGLAQDKITELRNELDRFKRASMGELDLTFGSHDMPRRRSVGADSYEKCNQLEEEISRMRDMNNLLSERLSKADAELRARPEHDTSLRLNLSSLSTENTNKVCDKCPDLEEQITKLRNMIRLQNSKVETLEKQNDELRYAAPVGKVIPQVEYDRMVKERDRIREDYESVKNDYDELESRHRRYLTDHITRTLDNPRSPSKTSDSIDGKSVEYEQLKRCNEDLEKRIDLFQSQSSLAENTKKRTEEKIQKLEAEVHELKVALATKNQERVKSGKLPIVIWTGEEDANDDEIIQAVMKEMDDGEEESWDDDHDESDSDGVDDDNTELVDFKSDPTDSTDITPASQPVAIVSDAKTHASLASEIEQKNLIIEKIQREMQDKLEEKNQIIQRIETEKDNRLSEQTSEIAKLKKQRDELIHERKRLEKLKRELGMKIDEQNAKIEKLQENNPQYDQHELSMRIDELQNELLNVFQSSKTTQEKNEITIQHLHKQLQEKQDEIQQLEDFLTEKEDEFETLKQKKMFGSEGMEKEMGKKMEFLKKSKERQEAIVKDLKEELSRKNEQMKWWKEKHDHELQKLRQDSEEKENIIKKLESEIAQYKNDIEKKKNQITSLQEELEDEKMSKMTPRNKEITQSMEEVSKELISVRGELQKVWDMIHVKETQLEEQEHDLLAALRKQDDLISEKDESVRKYDEELEQKTNKIKMLENKVDAQKNEIIILQEMTSAMEDKKQKNGATKCAKCQEKDKTIQTLTQEVKRLEKEIKTQKEEMVALNDVIGDLERQKQSLIAEKKEIAGKIELSKDAIERCEKLEIENEQLIVEKEDLMQRQTDLENDKKRLRQSLENKRKSRSDLDLNGTALKTTTSVQREESKDVTSPRQLEPLKKYSTGSQKAIPYPRPSLSSPRQPPSCLSSPRPLSSSYPSTGQPSSFRSPRQSLSSSSSSSSGSSSNSKKFTLPSSTKFKAAIPCLTGAVSPPTIMNPGEDSPTPTANGDNLSLSDSFRSSSPSSQRLTLPSFHGGGGGRQFEIYMEDKVDL